MLYRSTRDKTIKIESAQAIQTGLSKEGGLFVPESLPAVSLHENQSNDPQAKGDQAGFCISNFL